MVEDVPECAGLRKSEPVKRGKTLDSSEIVRTNRVNRKALAMQFNAHKVGRFIRRVKQ